MNVMLILNNHRNKFCSMNYFKSLHNVLIDIHPKISIEFTSSNPSHHFQEHNFLQTCHISEYPT